jgi:hypothetical protein
VKGITFALSLDSLEERWDWTKRILVDMEGYKGECEKPKIRTAKFSVIVKCEREREICMQDSMYRQRKGQGGVQRRRGAVRIENRCERHGTGGEQ